MSKDEVTDSAHISDLDLSLNKLTTPKLLALEIELLLRRYERQGGDLLDVQVTVSRRRGEQGGARVDLHGYTELHPKPKSRRLKLVSPPPTEES